jgi:hypothetical protein
MQISWLDEKIAEVGESTTRQLSRRRAITRLCDWAFKGTLVVVMGLQTARDAWAHHCGCSFPNGVGCPNCPGGGGCPSGCSNCVSGQHQTCIYGDANWTDSCANGGYVICYDCWCTNSSQQQYVCGCKSNIIGGSGGGDECDGWEVCGKCKCI